jgi:hypothetical protein
MASCVGMFELDWDGGLTVETFRVCRDCPVRGNCLMEALDRVPTDDSGVWGGTTAPQRRRIRAGRLDPAVAWADNAARWRLA